jgi:predicted metalloprotease with PDZ domain
LPGSRGQRAGVGYGDIVLSVNGVRTSNMGEFLEARNLSNDVLQLVVFRNGAEVSVEIELDPELRPARTPDELTAMASEVVAARLVPTERPPPSDEGQV